MLYLKNYNFCLILTCDNFQPPDERYSHGQIKGYRVNYSLTDSLDKLFSMKSEAKISTNIVLESYADYRLTVEAETETGYNSSLTLDPIFISSQLKSNWTGSC